MRIETVNGRNIVCGHIYKQDELKVGQRWAPADGANRVVEIRSLDPDASGMIWVQYGEYGTDRTYEKDYFSFQCRYCLIVEN